MNKKGQTKLLAAVAVFAMVACALAVVMPTDGVDGVTATAKNTNNAIMSVQIGTDEAVDYKADEFDEAMTAINEAKSDVKVTILQDFTVTLEGSTQKEAAVWFTNADAVVTIDGKGKTISVSDANKQNEKNIMGFGTGVKATVTDLTVNGTNNGIKISNHGFNVYKAEVSFTNVTSIGNSAAGFTINGSTVTMKNCVANNNGWGDVNPDKGSNFTIDSATVLGSNFQIWSEDVGAEDGSTINALDYVKYGWTKDKVSSGSVYFKNGMAKNLTLDNKANEKITIKEDALIVSGTVSGTIEGMYFTIPEGVSAHVDNNGKIILEGTVAGISASIDSEKTWCEKGTFEDVFKYTINDSKTETVPWGYNFVQINGISISEKTMIKQENSALGVFENSVPEEYTNVEGEKVKVFNMVGNTWVKEKPYESTNVANGYAFLIPNDNSTVTVTIRTSPYVFDFSGVDYSEQFTAGTAAEAESAFRTADVVTINSINSDNVVIPDEEGKVLKLTNATNNATFTLKYGDKVVANFEGATGIKYIAHGSIIIDGTGLNGTVTVADGQTLRIGSAGEPSTPSTNGNLTVILGKNSQLAIDENLAIAAGNKLILMAADDVDAESAPSVLIIENVKVTLMETSSIEINKYVRVNNYGSIVGGTIDVKERATFYSASAVDTTFTGDGNIDLNDALETLKISDKLASSAILKPTQNVLINGNLTINEGEYLVITGSLEIEEGVTVTINEGGLLMVYGKAATADIRGNIVSKGAYSGTIQGETNPAGFTYIDGKSIDVTGTITAKKAISTDDVTTVKIAGESNIEGTITIDSKAVAEFGEAKIAEGGVLNVNGTYSGKIKNQGTVNINGAVSEGSVIKMNAITAVLNMNSLKGNEVLTVNDLGLYLQTINDVRKEVGTADVNEITLKNVKGVVITEGYTYTTAENGDRIVHNNMYIAGTLNAQDSKNDKYGEMTVSKGVLTVSDEMTIANVDVSIVGKMTVSGKVYITDDDRSFDGTGTLTVTGLVRSVLELDGEVNEINAVKYEKTENNVPIYYYTNLADAIASGETDLTVLGNLYILKDTTIPSGITVDASGRNVYVGSTEKEITDITLTVSNGGLLMASTITVEATMVIENTDTGIDCNTVVSDVSSETETSIKYTNIYTALAQAVSGETVTITKSASANNGTVSIIRDVEIAEGVTLIIPAINKLEIAEGVTVTNNGTIDNRGSIDAKDGNDADSDSSFGTVVLDKDGKGHAVIANNGTIVSLSNMNHDKYKIPGAYYTINGKFYITPVEDSVDQIGKTETDSITIYGKNTVAPVVFVGTVDEPVRVNIAAGAEINAESMTVNNGKIIAAAGAKLDGIYGGSNGSVAVKKMTVPTVKTFIVEDKAVMVSEQTRQVTYITGDLNAIVSENGVNETPNKQIVSSVEFNGEVSINGILGITMSLYTSDNKDSVHINGTLTVAKTSSTGNAELTVEGVQSIVDGTLIADNGGKIKGDVAVLGTLDVKDKTDKTLAGTTDIDVLRIGATNEEYGSDVAAVVNGKFTAKEVFVFSKAVLDDAAKDVIGKPTVKSTEFYVEDTLWMTAYDMNNSRINICSGPGLNATITYGLVPTDLVNSKFDAWQFKSGEKYTNIVTNTIVGDYDKVYALIDYEIYTITVFADPGITAVYVDGKLMTSGTFQSNVDGMWAKGFQMDVAAGNHEITYKLNNYFSGDAKMTVNGTAVNGNTFVTSGTDAKDTQVTIYLQGIEASAPETPSTPGSSSDDGMGLTDYLLIVLVVLIVVMAIMVALRMMRS